MTRIFLIVILGLIGIQNVDAKEISGFYISNSNDTLKVTFKIPIKLITGEPNYERLQQGVTYIDSVDNKITLRPDSVKEIQFEYENQIIRMISRPNTLALGNLFSIRDHIFLRLLIDGKLKLFKYFFTQSSPGMFNASGMYSGGGAYSSEKYILQKGNGSLFEIGLFSFRNDMLYYLADCPSLAKKIQDRFYRQVDIYQIVDEYNQLCK